MSELFVCRTFTRFSSSPSSSSFPYPLSPWILSFLSLLPVFWSLCSWGMSLPCNPSWLRARYALRLTSNTLTLLPQPLECWNVRHVLPYPAPFLLMVLEETVGFPRESRCLSELFWPVFVLLCTFHSHPCVQRQSSLCCSHRTEQHHEALLSYPTLGLPCHIREAWSFTHGTVFCFL